MPDSNATSSMKVLLCTVPDGTLEATLQPIDEGDDGRVFQATLGIQALIDWMRKNGRGDDFEYYDINNLRPTDEAIRERFSHINPTVVGLSAPLSHCYPNIKRISAILRDMFPDVWIVVGGHVTASAKVILEKTEADICVVGDGETAWLKLLDFFESTEARSFDNSAQLDSIMGVSFIGADGEFHFNGYGMQLSSEDLDFIDFEFMKKGLYDRPDLFRKFFPPSNQVREVILSLVDKNSPYYREGTTYDPDAGGTMASIPTSKGCVAKCTFCQRYTKGYRIYDLERLDAYIRHLKETYRVDVVTVADENFGSNVKQAREIAQLFKKHEVFWLAGGARCTSFSRADLKFLRDNNCIYIKFGIESGSQTILDVMEKKFRRDDVVNVVRNCKEVGLLTTPDALMLGMPGETTETVTDSANMIGHLRYIGGLDNQVGSPFWATAFPGTPLFEYAQQIGVVGNSVDDEEEWLYRLSESKTTLYNYCNQTSEDVKTIFFWNDLFLLEGKRAYQDNLMADNIPFIEKIKKFFTLCVRPEITAYLGQVSALENKNNPEYVGRGMSFSRKILSHGAALTRLGIGIANLILPRSVVYPLGKWFSDIKYDHIRKNHQATIGKLNLFRPQRKPDENMLITPEKLKAKKRQQERSLRYIVKENREFSRENSNQNMSDPARLSLAAGQ